MMVLKKGTQVKVISGKDKGKTGEILEINKKLNKVKVKLQKNIKVTPIFKTELYTSYLEEGLKKAYKIFYSGKSAQNIEVEVEAVQTNVEIPS